MPNTEEVEDELVVSLRPRGGDPLYTITPAEKSAILNHYQTYDANLGQPNDNTKDPPLDESLLEALHKAFESTNKDRRLYRLRSRLFMATTHCPYCGFGSVVELDHYLPRHKYKALSIYARNLIPTCPECNKIKSNRCSHDTSKQFTHSYFSRFPDEHFFKADVIFNEQGMHVKFCVTKTENMDQDTYDRINHQIKTLKLEERYQVEIIEFLCGLEVSLDLAFDTPQKGKSLQKYLNSVADSLTQRLGRNHWKSVTVRALAGNEQFCNGGFKVAIGRSLPGA